MSSRTNAAALLASQTATAAGRTAKAANDVTQSAEAAQTSRWVLNPELRARLLVAAVAVPDSAVERIPAYAEERFQWMEGIAATAWTDREVIARTHLRGVTLAPRDLDEFGYRVAFARESFDRGMVVGVQEEALAQLSKAKPTSDVTALSTKDLRIEMRARRNVLCDALKDHLAVGSPARRDVLAIRADAASGHHAKNNTALLGVFTDEPKLVDWLRSLPKNESASLERLQTLEGERARRAAVEAASRDDEAPIDLPERAYALARASLRDVLHVGRYLVRGVAARAGDYAGFKAPAKTAKKTKKNT